MWNVDNASVLEIIWTTMALIGLTFSFANMGEAIRDWMVIKKFLPVDARHLLARQAVRAEVVRVFELIVFIAIGGIAMFQAPRSEAEGVNYVVPGMFIAMVVLIASNSLMDFRVRRAVNYLSATVSNPWAPSPSQPGLRETPEAAARQEKAGRQYGRRSTDPQEQPEEPR